jgi:putative endonuclease
MFTTYVIRSRSGGQIYTGSTSNFETRLNQHNSNVSISTKNRGPWELLYREDFETRGQAMARERYFKTGVGREKLKGILLEHARSSAG